MKRFQELLMKDLGWKLLSVAIATIMWFMVINITQPIDTRGYNRPLAIENLDTLTSRGLTVGNMEELKNTKITVKVKAQRTALDRLNQNPEWIQATVDLSELSYAVNGDIVTLPVDVSIQNSSTYGITGRSPASVEIQVETLATKELPVEVLLNGTLDKDMYLSEPKLSSETVTVTGPASLVDRVKAVRATVNAEDIKESPAVHAELICYDAQGMEVEGVSTSVPEITISYALHDMKEVPIQIEITGTPASGYQVGEITCSPQYAQLTGEEEDLENIIYLQMDSIDVSGRTSSTSRVFSLADYLPEGISLLEGSPENVQVVVEITTQSSKQLTLPASSLTILGQEDGKEYTLHGDAHITITGDNLDDIHANDLEGAVYVNGLSAGDHRVMVHVDLPGGYSMNPAYITVTVTDADASTEE